MASRHQRALGVFPNRTTTASALQALRDSGFSMADTSVITREANREADIAGVEVKESVGNQADTGGAVGAATGGLLGGVAGLLVGLGTIAIPGVGATILAGEAAAVLTTLVGAAGGAVAGGLVGALIGLGVPEHRAKEYSDRVSAGDYLVMVKGTEVDLNRAEKVLKQHNIQDWGIYDMPDTDGDDRRAVAADRRDVDRRDVDRRDVDRRDIDRDADRNRGPIAALRDTTGSGRDHDVAGQRQIIGVFSDWHTMETALDQVRGASLLRQVAIAVKDDRNNESYLTGDRGPLGGVTGLLSGLNRVDVPGIGPMLVIGPATSGLVREARDGHIGDMSDALRHLGISEEQASLYERRIADEDILVTMQGSGREANEVASLLGQHGMRDWGVYDIRNGDARPRV
ncbi:MAG: histidine kinase [Elainellaceae cyanobacterium]